MPGDARRGQPASVQPGGIIGQIVNRKFRDLAGGQPHGKLRQIAPIRRHRVRRQVTLGASVVDKCRDPADGRINSRLDAAPALCFFVECHARLRFSNCTY